MSFSQTILALLSFVLAGAASAASYELEVNGGVLTIRDTTGSAVAAPQTLTLTEPSPGQLAASAVGMSFQVIGSPTSSVGNSESVSLAGLTKIVVDGAEGGDAIVLQAFSSPLPSLQINGGEGDDEISFAGDLAFQPGASLDLNLQDDAATPGVDAVGFEAGANVVLAGTGAAEIRCSQEAFLLEGASLETADGDILIHANTQAVPTTGNLLGITLNGGAIRCHGLGNVELRGVGGNSGTFNTGINLRAVTTGQVVTGASIRSGLGWLRMHGQGGSSAGTTNHGIYLGGAGTQVSSLGGEISLTGIGGGSGVSGSNIGVVVQLGALLSGPTSGVLRVTGTGGSGSGINSYGILVYSANSQITSTGADVLLQGTGGSGDGQGHYGILLQDAGLATAGGAGNLSLIGTGGTGAGSHRIGCILVGGQARTQGGHLNVEGTGGATTSCIGVQVQGAGSIKAGGMGTTRVTGTGGPGAGGQCYGVYVAEQGSTISSSGGPVEVTSRGGGSLNAFNNYGMHLQNGGQISSGGLGNITVWSQGGMTQGAGNFGIFMASDTATKITGAGNIDITALGGNGLSGENRGLQIQTGPSIAATGNGNISIRAAGGSPPGINSHGMRVVSNAAVTAEHGNITIQGTAGNASSHGFMLSTVGNTGSRIRTTGGGSIDIAANSIDLSTTGVDITTNNQPVTLRPLTASTPINLGSSGFNQNLLELSDAELDVISCSLLTIGSSQSGLLTQSAPITRTGAISLRSGQPITAGLGGVDFVTSNYVAPAGQTLRFDPGIAPMVSQLTVNGGVSLTGASFELGGSYALAEGEQLVLIDNQGNQPIAGEFAGQPEGTLLGLAGRLLRLTYAGGTGNDVALTGLPTPAPVVTQSNLAPQNNGYRVQLSLDGGPAWQNTTAELLTSSDLQVWTPVSQQRASGQGLASFDLTEPSTPAQERRFYRVRARTSN
jgi:mucin-19